MKQYIAIDVETTGLNPYMDRIIEIGAVLFLEDGTEISRYQTLINPECSISEEITNINGITNDMVSSSYKFKDVINSFIAFFPEATLSKNIVIAHNSPFDCKFISEEMIRLDLPWTVNFPVIDTLSFSKRKNPFIRSHSLSFLVSRFNLGSNSVHRAIDDCLHVKNLWLHLEGPKEDESKLFSGRIKNF